MMNSYLIWYMLAGGVLLIEAFTPGIFIFICFAGALVITGLVDQLTSLQFEALLLLDLILSVLSLLFIRPLLKTLIKVPSTQVSIGYAKALIGKEAMVFKAISHREMGAVKLYDVDEVWLAKSKGAEIGQGTTVRILEIEGNQLIVEAIQ